MCALLRVAEAFVSLWHLWRSSSTLFQFAFAEQNQVGIFIIGWVTDRKDPANPESAAPRRQVAVAAVAGHPYKPRQVT